MLFRSDDFCTQSVARDDLWLMETPQVFDASLLHSAYAAVAAKRLEITDEVSAMQAIGIHVKFIEANQPNPKITRPADLVLAGAILTIQ